MGIFAIEFADATPTPTPTPTPDEVGASLTALDALWPVVVGTAIILVAVYFARSRLADDGNSFIRGAIALLLVFGLLLYCGLLLTTGPEDADLRNLVFGALVASVASGTAYYFASKGSDEARKDMLAFVAGGTVTVPDLVTKLVSEATVTMSGSRLTLVTLPPVEAGKEARFVVVDQHPSAGTVVQPDREVVAMVRESVNPVTP